MNDEAVVHVLPITDPLQPSYHNPQHAKEIYDFYVIEHQLYQLHHTTEADLLNDCRRLGQKLQQVQTKHQFTGEIYLSVLPCKPDPQLDAYGGTFADNVMSRNDNLIRLEWANTDINRAMASVVHELAHSFRRAYDIYADKVRYPLTNRILHEAIAETLVELELGAKYVLHRRPIASQTQADILRFLSLEQSHAAVPSNEEDHYDALQKGEDKYAFGLATTDKLNLKFDELLEISLKDFLDKTLAVWP